MGERKCPLCFVRIPWTTVLMRSYQIHCPACHAPLEVSRYTRLVGGFGGLAGGTIAACLAPRLFVDGLWAIRIVAALVGFALVSALGVLLAGDLVVRPKLDPVDFPQPVR